MRLLFRAGWLLLTLLVVGAMAWGWLKQRSQLTGHVVSCADPLQGCRGSTQTGSALQLRFLQPASGLQRFAVTVSGVQAKQLSVQFDMQGMQMPPARFALQQQTAGWQGSAILPVCVQGRRDWQVTVWADGTPYRFQFSQPSR
ncbi:hypothetical protein [Leeia aquatica]|uniref:Uncharacterized protein n=1 Tax=Leeia aquatica TaxID=2725557 RepID=A0A847S0P1_9NEIS|nr:hypothetical protein [Leeia aquatica]NLR76910.1 hypothetical protein [Leeia aquatica]